MKLSSLQIMKPNANATSRYAKVDFEPWYNFFNVKSKAMNRITASARSEIERINSSIN
jgi:hypothetical protein